MLRFRRYRVFLACAFICVFLLYRVSVNSAWGTSLDNQQALLPPKANPEPKAAERNQAPQQVQKPLAAPALAEYLSPVDQGNGPLPEPPIPNEPPTALLTDTRPGKVADPYENDGDEPLLVQDPQAGARLSSSTIHWEKQTEWFPVPEESLIPLPTTKPKSLPRIQHNFGSESPDAKLKREERLAQVKLEMKRAWAAYEKYAFGHDELVPVSKTFKDPFCGWAATLVDAMDTLWIMDLKKEFNVAYEGLKHIDFTTTPHREEIPVFETTIRYLGGLLAAYDVTGGHKGEYPLLLKKAVELAEVLMGIFDTPNRMPVLYYKWKPAFASQPKRSSNSVSIAELGTLSMEFTRLAQLTGKDKYYDAVARITDALEEWQNRDDGTGPTIPGIFPENVDASGCNVSATYHLREASLQAQKQAETAVLNEPQGYVTPPAGGSGVDGSTLGRPSGEIQSKADTLVNNVEKRQVGGAYAQHSASPRENAQTPDTSPLTRPGTGSPHQDRKPVEPLAANGLPADWDCVAQNLTVADGTETYSMGGSQDSAYEYFPKQFLLLGGVEPKYRTLHEKTVAAVKKWLLFRPMAPDDPDILFPAKVGLFNHRGSSLEERMEYGYEVTHLACFLGGMFGLGAKIFESPDDLEIGKRLTDGCVWAYSVMPSGIMPEYAKIIPCEDAANCHWNETVWTDEYLDPKTEWRTQRMKDYHESLQLWEAEKQKMLRAEAERIQAEEEMAQRALGPAHREPGAPLGRSGVDGGSSVSNNKGEGTSRRDVDVEYRSAGVKSALDDEASPLVSPAEVADSKVPKIALDPETLNQEAIKEKMKKLEAEIDRYETTGSSLSSNSFGGSEDQVLIDKLFRNLPQRPVKPESHEEYVSNLITNGGLAPGFVWFGSSRYILRPEAIESVWYMYRITGDPKWQEKGWKMWQAVVSHTRTDIANTAIDHVNNKNGKTMPLDSMESFWLAETLKYFYLLYSSPDLISLDDWVLNTEAHPFRRPR